MIVVKLIAAVALGALLMVAMIVSVATIFNSLKK